MKAKLIGFIAAIIYRMYTSTFRWRLHFDSEEGRSAILEDLAINGPSDHKSFLYAFFHQDEFSFIKYFSFTKLCVMVSHSKDGDLMNEFAHNLGYQTVRGSSSRGGAAGLIRSLKVVRAGYKYSLAVDGPRGPIYEVKEGIVKVSEKTRRPIVGMKSFPEKYWQLKKSWNQAKIPKPFCKVHLHFSDPKMFNRDELQEKMMSFRD